LTEEHPLVGRETGRSISRGRSRSGSDSGVRHIRVEQALFDITLVDQGPGEHPQFHGITIPILSQGTPEGCHQVFKGRSPCFFNEDILGEHLIEVDLERSPDARVDKDLPKGRQTLQEGIMTPVFPIDSKDLPEG